jgi:hypothetical protein
MPLTKLRPNALHSLETLVNALASANGEGLGGTTCTTSGAPMVCAEKTFSLIAGGAGNTDGTLIVLPAGFKALLEHAFLEVITAPVAGGGLTSVTLTLGTSVGGGELLSSGSIAAGGLPAAGTTYGITLSQLGASMAAATGNRLFLPGTAPTTISFRSAAAGGGVTAGAVRARLLFTPLPLLARCSGSELAARSELRSSDAAG